MPLQQVFALTRNKSNIGGFQFDATIREATSRKVNKSSYPIQGGARINDHHIALPPSIIVTGIVSDIKKLNISRDLIIDDVDTELNQVAVESNNSRSQQALDIIDYLIDNAVLIDVQTNMKLYNDMVVTGYSFNQDSRTSRALIVDIELEQFVITETQVIDIPKDQLRAGTTRNQASSTVNTGNSEAVEQTEEQKASLIFQVNRGIEAVLELF